ncbi:MAG: class II aldolase/adducin family protein [Acidobacteria bacterium]|nr:class II aldolase/adducin family protein [Acidobacteriota bacterium]
MKSVDLSGLRLVSARDVETAGKDGVTEFLISTRTVITPSARDRAAQSGIAFRVNGDAVAPAAAAAAKPAGGTYASAPAPAAAPKVDAARLRLFTSPEAEAIKAEICNVGRKLWQRMYVDGNGGNISYRVGPNEVICTPTLMSKSDLTPADLCFVDLAGNQLAGARPRTSEILLHLEIYKAVPESKAVVHCHPPHATAYAITNRIPPTCIIPESEVFIGRVAVSPYETPGSQKFAETVIPFVKKHNTVLLANHGIVCWADTVTHAEWYAEVLDTYCWTLMLAAQMGEPISYIPNAKAADLLAIKQKLGLPDARYGLQECQLCDMPDVPGAIALKQESAGTCCCNSGEHKPATQDVEAIVQSVTDAVMAAINAKR